MSARATISVLALLLIAAGASAAPAPCCPMGRPTASAITAFDCCATMLAAPSAPHAILTTIVRDIGASTAVTDATESQGARRPRSRWAASRISEPSPPRTPLYRLHAQLLI